MLLVFVTVMYKTLCSLALAAAAYAQVHLNISIPGHGSTTASTYTNPILDGVAADP